MIVNIACCVRYGMHNEIGDSRPVGEGSQYRHAAEKGEMAFYPRGASRRLTQQQILYEATPCHPPTPQQQAPDY